MAASTRLVSAEPRYTASNVSNVLPSVLTITPPATGAVQLHHTDVSPAFKACNGSPVSRVASTFEPLAVIEVPANEIEFAKLSFGGRRIGSLTKTSFSVMAPDSTLVVSL